MGVRGFRGWGVVLVLLLVACGDDTADTCASAADCADGEICVNGDCVPVIGDAGVDAADDLDAGPLDAGSDAPVDTGPDIDAGMVDAGSMDTGPLDAGPLDAGPPDAGPPDLPQLVGHYRCEAFARGNMSDDSGRGHVAQCNPNCPGLAAGRRPGGGLVCDFGTSDTARLRVEFDEDEHRIDDGFTVAVWARFPSTRSGSLVGLPVGASVGNVWQIFASNAPDFMPAFVTYDGVDANGLRGGMLTLDTWHHLAISYDGTRKRLYVGGSLVASVDDTTVPPDGQGIFIGADQNAGELALPFDGELDEVRIYRGVLSGPEIAELTLE